MSNYKNTNQPFTKLLNYLMLGVFWDIINERKHNIYTQLSRHAAMLYVRLNCLQFLMDCERKASKILDNRLKAYSLLNPISNGMFLTQKQHLHAT